jgi:cysteinyl-tRNA synthetase
LERLYSTVRLVRERLSAAGAPDEGGEIDPKWAGKLQEARARFVEVMDDDFGAPQAIATLFDLGREVNGLLNSGEPVARATLQAIDDFYQETGGDVLGIIPQDLVQQRAGSELVEGLVRMLIDMRQQARENRDWTQADAIRDRLAELGVTLEDGSGGTRWRLGT